MSVLAVLTLKVSAILFLALIGTLLLRRSSAAARHWVLAVGVVSATAVPALHVLPTPPVVRTAPVGPLLLDALPRGPFVQLTEPAEPVGADGVGAVMASPPGGSPPGQSRPASAAVASVDVIGRLAVTIWLAGAFAGLGVLLVGLARLRWLRASSSRVTDGRWHRLCADLSRSCGPNRGVDLLLGPRPGLVATWGWRRPAVMLPASAAEWSAERMRVVLLHELAHARRGDWLLQMAAEALRCVWWFNPLAWMVRARLRRESEHAADDLVLAQGVPAATCATQLVELAREVRKHRRTWLPAPAMARPSHLERRVSAMLNPRTTRRPLTRFVRFGSLCVLVPVSIVVAGLQVGPVAASGSAESTGSAVEQEPPAEPSSARVAELVPVAAAPALQARVPVGPVSASGSAESTGSAVEQEPPAEPSSEQIGDLVAEGDEQQALLGASDRPTGRATEPIRVGDGVRLPAKTHDAAPVHPPEARTGIRGVIVEEATIGPTGEVDDIEVVRSTPELVEADEGRGAPGVRTAAADAGDRSYTVLAARRAPTLERELDEAAMASAAAPGEVFRDCDVCPEMVALPGADVAVGRFEVTLEEFRAFAEAVPDAAQARCLNHRSWRNPGFTQTERHPVTCVSWNDAQTYLGWLSLETGHQYRLPTDAEWDRGAAGSPKGCYHLLNGNRPGTCPVGSYDPSDAGLFDMVGNLWEWTNDCWDGNCGRRVLRGAGYSSQNWQMRPDTRTWAGPDHNDRRIGFRVARTLP